MFRITPAEAVELFQHADGENILMAVQIRNAYVEQAPNPLDVPIFSCGVCFNAGIIEGIRRERARKEKP